jgi:hypothetical protein
MQYNYLTVSPVSKFYLWLRIVSIAMAVFPVYLSPMINSLYPFGGGGGGNKIFNKSKFKIFFLEFKKE